MTATLAIVRVTVRNVLGLRRLLGFGILALFPGAIYFLIARSATDFAKAERFTVMAIDVFMAIVVPLIAVVVCSSVLGSERRGDTMSFLMLRPISRFSIAGSKLASAVVASFAITGVGALVLGGMSSIALGDFGYLFSLLAGTLVATIGYAAVSMPLGYLTERATLIGFIYIFVWESIVVRSVEGLIGTSLWRIGATTLAALAPADLNLDVVEATIGLTPPTLTSALIKVVVLAAASIGATGWLLRSRDLI